jgi:hypothetical protein
MPSFGLVILSKPEPRQGAERSRRLCESELRLDSDFGLGIFTMSERNQAGSLGLGEDRFPALDILQALQLIRSATICAKAPYLPWGGAKAFHKKDISPFDGSC